MDMFQFHIVLLDGSNEELATMPGWTDLNRQIIRAEMALEHDSECQAVEIWRVDQMTGRRAVGGPIWRSTAWAKVEQST